MFNKKNKKLIIPFVIFILIIIILLYIQRLYLDKEKFYFNENNNNKNKNKNKNNKNNVPSPSETEDVFDFFEPVSPFIKRIKKDKTNVLVEWDNENVDKVKQFIVIYKNQDNLDKATWILRNIKSNKENNSLILRDMYGKQYHITILAIYVNKEKKELVSEVGRIILFGDGNDYNGIEYNKGEDIDLNIRNDKEEINDMINNPRNNIYGNNINRNEEYHFGRLIVNDNDNDNVGGPVPTINCDGKVEHANIRNKKDLEDIEINYKCPEDNEIKYLRDEVRNYRPFFSFF